MISSHITTSPPIVTDRSVASVSARGPPNIGQLVRSVRQTSPYNKQQVQLYRPVKQIPALNPVPFISPPLPLFSTLLRTFAACTFLMGALPPRATPFADVKRNNLPCYDSLRLLERGQRSVQKFARAVSWAALEGQWVFQCPV